MCALGGWVDPFLSSQRSPILHGSWKELDHLFTSKVPLIHCRWEEIPDEEAQACELMIAQLEEASTRAEALKVPSLHRHQHRKRPSGVVKPWGRGTGCKGGGAVDLWKGFLTTRCVAKWWVEWCFSAAVDVHGAGISEGLGVAGFEGLGDELLSRRDPRGAESVGGRRLLG